MVDRAVHLADFPGGKPRLLELAVDVAGVDKGAIGQLVGDRLQDGETAMRKRFPVALQAVAVEAPGEFGVVLERLRGGDLLKADARFTQGRVGPPQAFRSAEIGEARVDTHAGADGEDRK